MRDAPLSTPEPAAFEPFGEPVALAPLRPADRRARTAAIAVFWSLALLLAAGRAYHYDLHASDPAPQLQLAAR